jgi:hypothetical protein
LPSLAFGRDQNKSSDEIRAPFCSLPKTIKLYNSSSQPGVSHIQTINPSLRGYALRGDVSHPFAFARFYEAGAGFGPCRACGCARVTLVSLNILSVQEAPRWGTLGLVIFVRFISIQRTNRTRQIHPTLVTSPRFLFTKFSKIGS